MYNITIISGYFYPEDTAIGLYNTQMVEYLENKGYKVNIITGFPCYPEWKIRDNYKSKKTFFRENLKKAKIYRYKQYVPSRPTFLKRIILILDFTIGSFFNVVRIKECDFVFSVVPHTSTIFLGWILKAKTKAKLWCHIQDFEFDAVQETGISSSKSLLKKSIFSLLFKCETYLLNKADINSSISYTMVEKLIKKSSKQTYYFPNWIDSNVVNPSISSKHDYLNSSKFKILYSGNIGEKQDWDFFLLFANRLRNCNVEIIVVGDGVKKEWLLSKIKHLDNIKYFPPVVYSELSSLLCSADLHILFQKTDVKDSVMPSKLLGMMASSKPSLISGNAISEVKRIIDESQGGVYVSGSDIEKCVSVVMDLKENQNKVLRFGLNARNYVIREFSKESILAHFERTLSDFNKSKFN